MNKILFFSFILCSVISAQKPVPCDTPLQWEGRIFQYNVKEKLMVRARYSYDQIYHRQRIIEEYQLGNSDDFYDYLYLYNQQLRYQFNLKTRVCQKQAYPYAWRDFSIPSNATSYGESYIGSSAIANANVLTTSWAVNWTDNQGNVTYYSTWTLEGCLPVSSTLIGDTLGILHEYFFDISVGIQDPNVFVPRPECLNL